MITQDILQHLFSMNIHDISKGLGPIWTCILSTLFIYLFSIFSKFPSFVPSSYDGVIEVLYFFFLQKRRQVLLLTGEKESLYSQYNSYSTVMFKFSDRFRAFWKYSLNQLDSNKDIYSVKESNGTNDLRDDKQFEDIYIVNQNKSFLLNRELEIYAIAFIKNDISNSEKKTVYIESYLVEIYSYKSNVKIITKFIDELTSKYLSSIQTERSNKQFCYTLTKIDPVDLSKYDYWSEVEFNTTRDFKNIFFEEKQACIKQLDFFLENRDWYYDKGIPHSLGYGLYGSPGTGKTSFIKCLAKKTKRNIVNISLKIIKTKRELEDIFFENKYNRLNKNRTIDFEKKIIVFEDIDCIGDLVKNREMVKAKKEKKEFESMKNIKEITNLVQKDEPVTLDDFLNLLDGVRETPGRIIIITSNYYQELDPALIRPGRIDCTIEMKKVNHSILIEMIDYYYEKKVTLRDVSKIKEYFYSPAEIINLYVCYKNDYKAFLERLKNNKGVFHSKIE